MHRALLLAVVLLGALPTAVATAAQPRIVNGQPAQAGVYPSQGFLAVDVGGGLAGCAGTVVAPTKFVTAAHCVAGDDGLPRPPSAFSVFLGEVNRSEFRNAEQPVVAAATVHPDYAEDRGGNTDDVAVLTFDAPVAAAPTRIIRPAETALWAPGAIARIIGWGATFEGGSGTNELRQADSPIRSDAVCSDPNAYGEFFIATTMVCAGAADGLLHPQHGHLPGRLGRPAAGRQPRRVGARRRRVVGQRLQPPRLPRHLQACAWAHRP